MVKAKLNEKLQLTVRKTAAYTGIGEQRIRQMIKDGEFTDVIAVGPQHRLFLKRESIDKYFWGSDK